jgi:2-oxoglutarate dehydrogenase E1 component
LDEKTFAWEPFRRWGFLKATLDPLGRMAPERHPELAEPGDQAMAARAVYCTSIGAEFIHVRSPERRCFIREKMEPTAQKPDRARILDRLLRADLFEEVLQSRYIGTKR